MYKVKIFHAENAMLLQQSINEWLYDNKDILIHNSNLSGGTCLPDGNPCDFFILYSSTSAQAQELKEIASTAVQDQSIEVKEINPEILKPSS